MRKLIIVVAFILGIIFIITRIGEIQSIAGTLQHGDWRFLLLATGVILIWFVNVAASYQTIYKGMGLEERIEKLVVLAAAAYFVNVVAPTAVGMGGMGVFFSEARRRGYSSARATIAGVLYVLYDYIGFLSILSVGLIVLIRRNNINIADLIATAILVGVASLMFILIYLGMRSESLMGRALAWLARLVNKMLWPILHREYLVENRAYSFAHDAADGLQELRRKHQNLLFPALLALSSKLCFVFVLLLCFFAFGVPFTAGTIIAGYSISYLFTIVSITPAGIGVVEGAMTIALDSLGVPLGSAAIVSLAYRGLTFWIPLLIGFISFRWLSRAGMVQDVELSDRGLRN